MRNGSFLLTGVAGLLLAVVSQAQPPTLTAGDATARQTFVENNLASPLERKHGVKRHTIEDAMARLKVPGVSVAVLYDGKIDWAKGYGVLEAGKPEPVTAETLFQAASISKPFSALAALRLVHDGKLTLDSNVNDALRAWKLPDSPLGVATLRQLLSHRAGLTVHGFAGYAAGAPLPTIVQILNGEAPANNAPIVIAKQPGAQFQYSGGGYSIVQLLLCETTGKSYPDLMRELVLEPLGMTHSTYEQPLPDALRANAATAHNLDKPVPGSWHTYPEMAAAGLWTTPTDLLTAALELQREQAGTSSKALDKAGIEELWARQGDGPCGLGFFLSGDGDAARFEHNGGNEGITCSFVAYQRRGLGAAVMTNSSNGAKLFQEIFATIAETYAWPGYLDADT